MPKIAVLGAGGPAGSNLVACLQNAGHHVVAHDENPWHLELLRRTARPKITDTVGALVEIPGPPLVDLVMAQPDVLVDKLAEARDRGERVSTFLPPTSHLTICRDKYTTAITLPDSIRPRWAKDLEDTEPAWVRLRHGAGSAGSFAGRKDDCRAYVDAHRRLRKVDDWVAQEYLPGSEYALQVVTDRGDIVAAQARQRLQYANPGVFTGSSSSPSVAQIPTKAVSAEVTATALAALGAISDKTNRPLHGVYGVDMRRDRNSELRVTEINAGRFYTTTRFLMRAGLNLPAIAVDAALGELDAGKVSERMNPLEEGLTWVRQIDTGNALLNADDARRIFPQMSGTLSRTTRPTSAAATNSGNEPAA